MNWQPIPSVNEPHYLDTNLNAIQKCSNWYHEKTPSGLVLKSLQGYSLLATVAGNASCRGAILDSRSSSIVSVHGNTVYTVNSLGASTALTGTLSTSSGAVVLFSGLSTAILTDGTYGYVVDVVGGTVTKITDANFPASPTSCACINGQFLVNSSGTDRWYMSAVDDGLTWTPIISGRSITNGDYLTHIDVVRDVVYFMGRYSIEIWSTSTVDPYLQPITGSTIPLGVISPINVGKVGGRICLLGYSETSVGSFYVIDGGQPQKIATPYIESQIKAWPSARVIAYSADGCDFMEAIPGAPNNGFLYNLTTGTWSETPSGRSIKAVVRAFVQTGTPVAFDSTNGNIYALGASNSNNGTAITRILDFKVDGGVSRTFCAGLRFEFEAQHDSSSSYTLSATLQKSDDAGLTFDTGITLSKAVTNGTSAQQVILQSPPTGSFKAGQIYRLTFAGPAARLILRRAEGLVRVGRF